MQMLQQFRTLHKSKKIVGGISIIIIAILVLLMVHVLFNRMKKNSQTSKHIVDKTAMVSFNPSVISVNTVPSQTYHGSVMVDTGGKTITGVQLDISYDPHIISNFDIAPGANNFFGSSSEYFLFPKTIDVLTGKVFYAIGIQPGGKSKIGTGQVASFVFSIIGKASSQSTYVTFGSRTAVTRTGETESVLKTASPLQVILK